jgi:SP family general alpha glucoside:H+ symporter-like MFS transporter
MLTLGSIQGGLCFCCIVYTFFRLPEPRDRTFAELDVLFEKKVPARQFNKTKVDVFHESVEDDIINQYEQVDRPGAAKPELAA